MSETLLAHIRNLTDQLAVANARLAAQDSEMQRLRELMDDTNRMLGAMAARLVPQPTESTDAPSSPSHRPACE